ncbi:MAG TPA: MFS transporter [Myxococcota bacterium]|nr:MFS transporter [Myxococcota bacterium]
MPSKRSPHAVLFLTVLLDLVGFGIILPLLPFYAVQLGGSSGLKVGLLGASYSLTQFIFAPVWGRLSDRIGRRPVLLVSVAGNAVAMAFYGLSASYWALLVARSFAGACAANVGAAQAYMADVTTPENRARGMGLIGAAFGLGFVLGPMLGGLLSHWAGTPGHPNYAAPGFAAAALGAVNFLLALGLLPESLPPERRTGARRARFGLARALEVLSRRGTGVPIWIFFLSVMGFAGMEATYALFTALRFGYTGVQNGYLFCYIGLIIVIIQGTLIGRLVRRLGEKRLVLAGLACLTAAMLTLPASAKLGVLLVASGLFALGNGLKNPSLSAIVSQQAGAVEQGGVLGISQGMGSLARVFGPILGGWMWDLHKPWAPYLAGGVLMAGGLVLAAALPGSAPLSSGVSGDRAAGAAAAPPGVADDRAAGAAATPPGAPAS